LLLAGDELVRPTEEDLGGQVPAQLAAERALDGDGLKGELLPTGCRFSTPQPPFE
jgi:hypothetical protein